MEVAVYLHTDPDAMAVVKDGKNNVSFNMYRSILGNEVTAGQLDIDEDVHRQFFILPCLTTSYWCITNTLGKWWKMAVGQNPGTGYLVFTPKWPSFCHPFILSSPFVIEPSLFGETVRGLLPSWASNKSPWWCRGATIVVFHEKRAHVQKSPACWHQHPCREVMVVYWADPIEHIEKIRFIKVHSARARKIV